MINRFGSIIHCSIVEEEIFISFIFFFLKEFISVLYSVQIEHLKEETFTNVESLLCCKSIF